MFKKYFVGILASSLMLLNMPGCNQANRGTVADVAMGRYIEEEAKIDGFIPDTPTFLVANSKQTQIYQQTEKGFQIVEVQADGSWQRIEPDWLEEFNKQYGSEWFAAMTMNEKGEPYFIGVGNSEEQSLVTSEPATDLPEDFDLNGEDVQLQEESSVVINMEDDTTEVISNISNYVVYIEDNEIKTCGLQVTDESGFIIPTCVEILPNQVFAVAGNLTGQKCFDLSTGQEIKSYSKEDGNIARINNKLCTINLMDNQIDVYDEKADEIERSIPCEGMDELSVLLPAENNNMYLLTRKGIQHFAEGGSIWEELMSSAGFSLGLPSYRLVNAAYSQGQFIVHMTNEQYQNVIKVYRYSETTPTLPTEELNVYTLEGNKTVEEAVTAYQLAHPEVRINIQVGLNGEGGITKEEAIKSLNAAILAGDGPDLMILDGLPIGNYIEKGVLADLSQIEGIGELFQFAKTPFETQGQLYALPLRFKVPTMWGNTKVLEATENLETLANYQKAHSEVKLLRSQEPTKLIKFFAGMMQENWFNAEGDLQEAALISFLEDIKTFVNLEDLLSMDTEVRSMGGYGLSDQATKELDTLDLLEYAFGETQVSVGDVGRLLDLLTANEANSQKGNGGFKLIRQGGERVYKPNNIIGLNASSSNKEVATDIMGFMLSEKMQLTDTLEGFPTHQATFEKWINGETTNKDVAYSFGYDNKGMLAVSWGHEEALVDFYEEVKQIKKAVLSDTRLIEMLTEGSQDYFEEQKTSEEVATTLKATLELYSKE